MRELVGNLSQTNYYFVDIPITSPNLLTHFQTSYSDLSDINEFVKNKLGFLCSEATLPTTSYATAEVKDNFMGITQEFAHTRLYTDIDLTFYVDSDYSILRFFEGWMDYISGGNLQGVEPAAATRVETDIYRRFNFPEFYKCQKMTITKFERDFNKQLQYTFVNAFPKGLTSIPVSYGPADLLKVTVTFNYDRYVVGRKILKESPFINPQFGVDTTGEFGQSGFNITRNPLVNQGAVPTAISPSTPSNPPNLTRSRQGLE